MRRRSSPRLGYDTTTLLRKFAAGTSTFLIAGGSTNRSDACAIKAAAIGPERCACRPIHQEMRRKCRRSMAASFSALAFNRTKRPTATIVIASFKQTATRIGRRKHACGDSASISTCDPPRSSGIAIA